MGVEVADWRPALRTFWKSLLLRSETISVELEKLGVENDVILGMSSSGALTRVAECQTKRNPTTGDHQCRGLRRCGGCGDDVMINKSSPFRTLGELVWESSN